MRSVPNLQQKGFTLTELVIVISTLGLIAAIAVPAISSSSNKKLDLAVQEFVTAIRFARSESTRTSSPHGFHHESGAQRIRVWRADTTLDPATIVYDVRHPIDKQFYDIDLNQIPLAAATTITQNSLFRGTCSSPEIVYFDANGSPWCESPGNVLLESFELIFQSGSAQRTLTVDGITGRVTVQ
jgi:prepilin-type N-terminal cleavage/methylation domain-containing protein